MMYMETKNNMKGMDLLLKRKQKKAETDFKVLDPSDISNMKFIDLWEAYRDINNYN